MSTTPIGTVLDLQFSARPQSHNCSAYDGYEGRGHLHCGQCDAIVNIEQEGPDAMDFKPLDGAICHGELVCNDCMTSATPSGERMCKACAGLESDKALEADEIFNTLVRATEDLKKYHARMCVEANPVAIKESAQSLHDIEALLEDIHRDLLPSIQRAYGALPCPA